MTLNNIQPEADEIEISVFSRGYGESIAIHVGGGKWLVIDSLKSDHGRPASLEYLESIGIDAATNVLAVLITHWHDDHIGGAAELVRLCSSATVALSGILMKDEFRHFLDGAEADDMVSFSSGLDELTGVLTEIENRKYAFCWNNKIIFEDNSQSYIRLECLSPSDKDYLSFLREMPKLTSPDDVQKRVASPHRNDASVAAVVQIGDDLLLFGADLEVNGAGSGWEAVHSTAWNSRGRACFFKIPHHGSKTGHYLPVWQDMMVTDVVAALTPWNRGSKLPSSADIDRIMAITSRAHSAATVRKARTPKRSSTVEGILRDKKIRLSPTTEEIGHLRFRKIKNADWRVEYGGDSALLSQGILT